MTYNITRVSPRVNGDSQIVALGFDVELLDGDVVLATRPYVEFYDPPLAADLTTEQLIALCEAVVTAKSLAAPKAPITQTPMPLSEDQKRVLWMAQIDNNVANVYNQFTRFQMEYEQREKAALAYKATSYTGDPTIWLTAFADSAGISYPTCADLVLSQANTLRAAVTRLGELRMMKYKVKTAETISEAEAAFYQIINDIATLARSL